MQTTLPRGSEPPTWGNHPLYIFVMYVMTDPKSKVSNDAIDKWCSFKISYFTTIVLVSHASSVKEKGKKKTVKKAMEPAHVTRKL